MSEPAVNNEVQQQQQQEHAPPEKPQAQEAHQSPPAGTGLQRVKALVASGAQADEIHDVIEEFPAEREPIYSFLHDARGNAFAAGVTAAKAPKDEKEEKGKKKKWTAGTPADHATAKDRHAANVKLLQDLIDGGKDVKDSKWGKRWPNACQWLLANKTGLHAFTETHGSVARAATLSAAAGERAYFGIATAVPATSDYNAGDQTDATNIDTNKPSTLGYRAAGSPSKIAILDPVTQSTELVKETIVHEVQHDADHHPLDDWGRYQSEFNSYWVDKTYGEDSPKHGTADESMTAKDGTALTGFDNARQQRIFKHLYDGYDYVTSAYPAAAFKTKVKNYKHPTGV